jgi:hypothetical protein
MTTFDQPGGPPSHFGNRSVENLRSYALSRPNSGRWLAPVTSAAPACTERSERVAAPSCPEPARRGGKPPVAASKGAPCARKFPGLSSPRAAGHRSRVTNHFRSLAAGAANRHIPFLESTVTRSKQTLEPTPNRHTSASSPFPLPGSLPQSLPTCCISNRTRQRLEIAVSHSKQTPETNSGNNILDSVARTCYASDCEDANETAKDIATSHRSLLKS